MLKEVFDAIKSNAKPAKQTVNGLEYVLQGDFYKLADDPEVIKQANELELSMQKAKNESDLLQHARDIESIKLQTEKDKILNPLIQEKEKLELEQENLQLTTELENKDLYIEKANLKAQIETEVKKNQLRDLKPVRKENFASIKSFVEFIIHESKKHNTTGKDYFIMLNEAGGKFYTDFERIKDTFTYDRKFSEVYNRLNYATRERTVNQKQLLEFLLENKHYIAEFATVFNSFKRVKNTTTSKFESEPMLTDSNEEVFEVVQSWNFNGEVKKEKITLIPEIGLKIPVINMGEVKYEMEMYITPIKGREGQIMFDLYAPGLEYVLQKALNDELEYTKEQLKDLTDAYIGLDI